MRSHSWPSRACPAATTYSGRRPGAGSGAGPKCRASAVSKPTVCGLRSRKVSAVRSPSSRTRARGAASRSGGRHSRQMGDGAQQRGARVPVAQRHHAHDPALRPRPAGRAGAARRDEPGPAAVGLHHLDQPVPDRVGVVADRPAAGLVHVVPAHRAAAVGHGVGGEVVAPAGRVRHADLHRQDPVGNRVDQLQHRHVLHRRAVVDGPPAVGRLAEGRPPAVDPRAAGRPPGGEEVDQHLVAGRLGPPRHAPVAAVAQRVADHVGAGHHHQPAVEPRGDEAAAGPDLGRRRDDAGDGRGMIGAVHAAPPVSPGRRPAST